VISSVEPAKLVFTDFFLRSRSKYTKAHFKKNPQAHERFELLLETILIRLTSEPTLQGFAFTEPLPKNFVLESGRFMKLYFDCRDLQNAAKAVRIMYIWDIDHNEVVLLWLYSHAEYPKRPPDRDIISLIQSAMKRE
jgi:hypothetical protein